MRAKETHHCAPAARKASSPADFCPHTVISMRTCEKLKQKISCLFSVRNLECCRVQALCLYLHVLTQSPSWCILKSQGGLLLVPIFALNPLDSLSISPPKLSTFSSTALFLMQFSLPREIATAPLGSLRPKTSPSAPTPLLHSTSVLSATLVCCTSCASGVQPLSPGSFQEPPAFSHFAPAPRLFSAWQ